MTTQTALPRADRKWRKHTVHNVSPVGDRGERSKRLIATGRKCRRCEILVFTSATDAAASGTNYDANLNRRAFVGDDGLALCAACVSEAGAWQRPLLADENQICRNCLRVQAARRKKQQ